MENAISQIMMLTNDGVPLESALYRVLGKYDMTPKTSEIMVVEDGWKQSVEMYLARRMISGLKQTSLAQYQYHLSTFFTNVSKNVEDITENDISNYLAYMRLSRGLSDNSMAMIHRCLNAFFTWQTKKGYLNKNPMAGIDSFKTDKSVFYPFTDEELEKIRMACDNVRNRAIIEVLYSTGCRVSELCNLKIDDVDFKHDEVRVIKGKGGKDRTTYLTDIASMYLKQYLDSRTDDNEYLFVSLRGNAKQMTKDGVENLTKTISKKTGVKKVHPHRFRRTLATNLVERGMPIQEVQKILGHESIETTMIYCSVAQKNIKNNHRRCA